MYHKAGQYSLVRTIYLETHYLLKLKERKKLKTLFFVDFDLYIWNIKYYINVEMNLTKCLGIVQHEHIQL